MKNFRKFISSNKRTNLRLFVQLSVVMLFAIVGLLVWQTAAQMQDNNNNENPQGEQFLINGISVPTLGNYPNTTVVVGANTTVTPSAAPTGATSINVSTNTNFKGLLAANPITGIIRVTNAHPAGTYLVTVKAFKEGGTTTRTFTLTVVSGTRCNGTVQFTNAPDISFNNNRLSLAIGDFNNDGNQDYAIANFFVFDPIRPNGVSSNRVSIRLGNGTGGFSNAPDVGVGAPPGSIAIGDFNNDGNQDFATANVDSTFVSIRLGDGAGNFSNASDVSFNLNPRGIAIGDFNNDGNQDFAVAGNNTTVAIRLGDGMGNFSGTTSINVGGGGIIVNVAIGDFNNDGNQDFATNAVFGNSVAIRLGDGTGNFGGTTQVIVGSNANNVAIGDFNGDGNQDFAIANRTTNTVSIRLGDGTGNFSGTTEVGAGNGAFSVAIGDFNNDGNQDIVANANSGRVSILLGNGTGNFTNTGEVFVGGSNPSNIVVGDLNNDGNQDFASANVSLNQFSPSIVSTRLGNCLVTPTPTPTPTPQTCTPFTTVTEGDLFPGGIVSFGVSSGAGSVTIDHVNAGTGLQSLTVVGVPTNATVNIPPFTPGTFNPVVVTFTRINPALPVDFTLRAASTFHAANIRVRCGTVTLTPVLLPLSADISIFRPSDRVRHLLGFASGFSAAQLGLSSDRIVAADYDGDGQAGIAVFRDGAGA